jgi:Tfp pilus assembly protein PilN
MIQFNLLPDVKKEYVKAKKLKRLIMLISVLVSAGSIVVVVLLFSIVQIAQKNHIQGLSQDIADGVKKIKQTEDLDTILSVQSQLDKLTDLHEQKPETSRLFSYLSFVVPEQVTIVSLDFDNTASTITLQGTSDSLLNINGMVENLRQLEYRIDEVDTTFAKAFSGVGTQSAADGTKASFKIDITYDPILFDNTNEIVLKIGTRELKTKSEVTQ